MNSHTTSAIYDAGRLYSAEHLMKTEGITATELRELVKQPNGLIYEIDKSTGMIQFRGSEIIRFFSKPEL